MYNPREAQRDFLYLRNVILIAFVLLGTVMVALNFRQGIQFAVLWLDGEKTIGKIISAKGKIWPKDHIATVTYSFRDNADTNRTVKLKYRSAIKLELLLNADVEVRYSPLFPGVSTITPLWSHLRFVFVFMISGVVVALIASGLSLLAVLSIAKHKQSDKRY